MPDVMFQQLDYYFADIATAKHTHYVSKTPTRYITLICLLTCKTCKVAQTSRATSDVAKVEKAAGAATHVAKIAEQITTATTAPQIAGQRCHCVDEVTGSTTATRYRGDVRELCQLALRACA